MCERPFDLPSYVTVNKTGAGRRSRTYVRLSPRGREVFDGHVAALQKLVNVSAPAEEPAS